MTRMDYVGKKVYPRRGSGLKKPGVVVGTTYCTLEGCGGTRLIVRWPGGKQTRPCARGCTSTPAGNLRIL